MFPLSKSFDFSLCHFFHSRVMALFILAGNRGIHVLWSLLPFLAHLAFRPCELLSSLFVRPSTFHILIFSSETTGPIATKLWWNDPWMAPFQNCVRWSRLPTKMAAKLKIEKRGDFNYSFMARSSLTYILGFSVNFFFQSIYTDYAN